MIRIIALIVSLLWFAGIQAQIFPARQYTTADELASSNVYDICHDEKGYLWFATERGLSRFDGYKFTNYLFKEGLEGAAVLSLATDNKMHVYAGTKQDGVYKLQGNFHQVLQEDVHMANEHMVIMNNLLYSLDDHNLVSVCNLKKADNTKKIFPHSQLIISRSEAVPTAIAAGSGDTVFIATEKGIYYSVNGNKALPYAATGIPCHSIYMQNGVLYFGSTGAVFRANGRTVARIATLSEVSSVKRLLLDDEGSIWCATSPNNYVFRISGEETWNVSVSLGITGTSIQKIFEDHEGNIWIATYGKGVFCMHHRYCTNYTRLDGLSNEYVTSVLVTDNGLLIGTYDGLYTLDETGIRPFKSFPGELEYIQRLGYEDDTYFVTVSGIQATNVRVKRTAVNGKDLQYLYAPASLEIQDVVYYNQWDNTIWRAKLNKGQITDTQVIYSDPKADWKSANAFYMDDKGVLWVGTTRGLLAFMQDHQVTKIDTGFFRTSINAIMQDDDGAIYVGTDKGLAILQNGRWTTHRSIMEKNIESITGLAHDSKHRIWISTLNGLFLYDGVTLIQFDARNTLLSDEIHAITYDSKNNAIWIGTTFGLSRIDVGVFDQTPIKAPAAIFKTLRAADSIYRDLGVNSRIELPYTSKNFTVRFSAIQFSAPEGIKFLYTFDDGPWEPTVGRQIEFASIPYGEHTIRLKSVGEQGVEGPLATLTIFVDTPFWATIWFKVLVGLGIGFIVYLLVRKRFELIRTKQQERLELQSKVAELRHQALAASMNPHFIFNALNSIQHFINSHNTEEATDYLGKFARLIRMMLDYGGRTFIPLKDELERLEYYLELEKVRFGQKLNYTIDVDDSLRNNPIEIPNMVIQPIVENALWHGLLPANSAGHLHIRFSAEQGTIVVTVDDDGIGIEESRRRKKAGHNSLGIQMIHERLEMLNKLSGYKASLRIIDKSTQTPAGQGTLAEIRLM